MDADYIAEVEADCCSVMGDDLYNALLQRLDDLEASIEEFCKCNSIVDDGGGAQCDGSTVTVSFGWNDTNQTSGKASAVSSGGAQIAGYHFLVRANNGGILVKKSIEGGWSIDGDGNVTYSVTAGNDTGFIEGIGATDVNGCSGFTQAHLPRFMFAGG